MFEVGKKYWVTVTDEEKKRYNNLCGEVMEENQFMVKIRMDNGNIEIIPFARVFNVNPAKEKSFEGFRK